ncbi:MAG: glycosyltransferase family 4 protein [Bacteroidetes bacterium]|nr:glycosyltransferase family 4 protein [Bacteroidota bacterium]
MSQEKCLHLTHTDIRSDSRILKEMASLVEAGFSVAGVGLEIDEGEKKSEVTFRGDVSLLRLASRSWLFLPRTLRHVISLFELIFKMLPRAIGYRPDVIHCHDTLVLPIGVVAKFFTGAKLIYDAHELESDRNGLTPFQGSLTLAVEKLLWAFVDALIVVSPSIERWYHKKIGKKNSVVILNSPVFSDATDVSDDYLRRRFSVPFGEKIFVYVGILGPGRGIDLLVDAFTKSDIKSHVVFLGFGVLKKTLVELSSRHSNLHIHEPVPHAQVVPIVRSADFGICLIENVSLSDYLCLPNKLFEYCFAGVPVLASNFPDIQTVVSEFNLGECCAPEPGEIARAIRKLETQATKAQVGDVSALGWQAQEQKLIRIYRSTL